MKYTRDHCVCWIHCVHCIQASLCSTHVLHYPRSFLVLPNCLRTKHMQHEWFQILLFSKCVKLHQLRFFMYIYWNPWELLGQWTLYHLFTVYITYVALLLVYRYIVWTFFGSLARNQVIPWTITFLHLKDREEKKTIPHCKEPAHGSYIWHIGCKYKFPCMLKSMGSFWVSEPFIFYLLYTMCTVALPLVYRDMVWTYWVTEVETSESLNTSSWFLHLTHWM